VSDDTSEAPLVAPPFSPPPLESLLPSDRNGHFLGSEIGGEEIGFEMDRFVEGVWASELDSPKKAIQMVVGW
jgi:hypothetical protein